MRLFLAFLLAALQISFASATLRLYKCGTTFPTNWVSNCSPADQQGCKDLCGQKCRTEGGRQMANGADCDCYCGLA
ncbi:hypothetical protein K4K61_005641 [Colletotrichum sp. SAR11_59]|uniref:Uncharacterized protein n=1 Tax=Colletotrichum asianum TaxID=702518 RepID=A0A8H3WAK8_9PEZI|nr:hypothetical protein GQ607_010258 [Colletotrichum asianum]KAI8305117.1 hypothetical protein K4K61_005641 [Colletotrichum sp. SAR11_59]